MYPSPVTPLSSILEKLYIKRKKHMHVKYYILTAKMRAIHEEAK